MIQNPQPDSSDHTDTGPLNVRAEAPQPGDGVWTNHFDSSAVPPPRPVRHGRQRTVAIGAAAVVAAIVVAAVGFWMTRDSTPGSGSPESGAVEPSAGPTIDRDAETRLKRLIPLGYPAAACESATPPEGALAQLNCTKNADPGGPGSASYTLRTDKASLTAAFDAYVRGTRVVNCPRNMQSPGPWRRNATPKVVSGTLVCGFRDNRPTVTWTDDAALVLNVTESGPGGPNLDQLYDWWSTHS